MAGKKRQPKYLWGKPNPNWDGPSSANEEDIGGDVNSVISDFEQVSDHSQEQKIFDHSNKAEYDGDHEALSERARELLKERQELADEIIEQGTPEEAMELMQEIVTSGDYDEVRLAQATHEKEWDKKHKKFQRDSRNMEKAVANGEGYPADKADSIYDTAQEAIENGDIADEMKDIGDQNLNVLAKLSHHLGESEHYDTIVPWKSDSLGPNGLTSGGEYEVGSREWLEFRQGGVGGSDIGAINTQGRFRFNNVRDVWSSKVEPISDEQVTQQEKGQVEFNDPMSRGNGLENFVAHLYGVRNPDVQLLSNKETWVKDGTHAQVNYDLLTCDDGSGIPNGCLEVKTSSRPGDWGEDGGGYEDIPENYRIQLLSQMRHAGFEKGSMTVLINGNDHRTYEVEMTPELAKQADEYIATANDFYKNAEKARNGQDHDAPYEVAYKSTKSFSKWVTNGTDVTPLKMEYFQEIASIEDRDVKEVVKDYKSRIKDNGGDVNAAMNGMYQDLKPSDTSRFIGVDIETTDLRATRGRIIEIGIAGGGRNMDELLDIPENHKKIRGTGAEDVHNISVNDLKGKASLVDEKTQERVLNALADGGPVVAHNASFEKQFLRAHIKGFAQAEVEGRIKFVDTKNIMKHGHTDNERDRLQDFVEQYGGSYEGAHRAHKDTEMMMDAFEKWSDTKNSQ